MSKPGKVIEHDDKFKEISKLSSIIRLDVEL